VPGVLHVGSVYRGELWDETQTGEEVVPATEGSAVVFCQPALGRPRLGVETPARRWREHIWRRGVSRGVKSVVVGGGAAKLRKTGKGGRESLWGRPACPYSHRRWVNLLAYVTPLVARARLHLRVGCKPSIRSQSDSGERCDRLKF
jgi:hypothetical protein